MLHTLIFSRLVPSCFSCLLFQLKFSESLSLSSKDAPNSLSCTTFYCLSSIDQYLILSIYFSPVFAWIKLHDSLTLSTLPIWFTSVSSAPKQGWYQGKTAVISLSHDRLKMNVHWVHILDFGRWRNERLGNLKKLLQFIQIVSNKVGTWTSILLHPGCVPPSV